MSAGSQRIKAVAIVVFAAVFVVWFSESPLRGQMRSPDRQVADKRQQIVFLLMQLLMLLLLLLLLLL